LTAAFSGSLAEDHRGVYPMVVEHYLRGITILAPGDDAALIRTPGD
jgi:hypothetical protein